jgi:hypothetical protein
MIHRSGRRKNNSGVTLTEVLLVVFILGMVIYVSQVGFQFINHLYYRTSLLRAQQEAELNLYNITRDVRNSKAIIQISPDTLVLRAFNPRLGYDVRANNGIFDPVNLTTTTYQFIQIGNDTYLQKSTVAGGQTVQIKSLKNMLLVPTATDYLFRYFQGVTIPNPQAVEICIRFDSRKMRGNNVSFSMTAMKRTRD